MLFEAIFIVMFSFYLSPLMKKMKRPVDLMNSAVRITTASQTTGGVTVRRTVEMAQTRRTAVSTPDNFTCS